MVRENAKRAREREKRTFHYITNQASDLTKIRAKPKPTPAKSEESL